MLTSPGEMDDAELIQLGASGTATLHSGAADPSPASLPPHRFSVASISRSNDSQAEVSPRVEKWHQFPGPVRTIVVPY